MTYNYHGFTSDIGIRAMAPAEALDSAGLRKISREQPRHNRDIYYGGTGQITGTVKEKHLPTDAPLIRRVQLIDQATKTIIRETWSDAVGNYAFPGIDAKAKYTIISYDHTGTYRAVIADNITVDT